MELFFLILVLLVVTRLFGELAERLGQPALIGELVSGVLLGAVFAQEFDGGMLEVLHELQESRVFQALTELGMFFIMLFAGIEMHPKEVAAHSKSAILTAVGGMIVPIALGIALGWYVLPDGEAKLAQSIFIGIALAVTAVPATVRILIDLDLLKKGIGQVIVAAAVFDDILSLVLLAWLTGLIGADASPSLVDIAIIAGKVILFFVVVIPAGRFLFPLIGKHLDKVHVKEIDFSIIVIIALAFGLLAHALGLHLIIGAFTAGVFFGPGVAGEKNYDSVRSKVSGVTFGFFAPLFFASIGFELDLSAVFKVPVFVLALIIFAFIGKLVGAGAGALLSGLGKRESFAVGVGMSARGAVELVIAGIALDAGLFDVKGSDSPITESLFSSIVIMAVVTTLLVPVLLKRVMNSKPESWGDH
ncbi:MAG: cation:proton antiporter [Alphaproteobacteria bacterium]|jgi:Kef-type K+ transport system membrane component KefB|nr:cation:proton antiporter [Alphaproteobacteria bacterium]MBT4016760.1 cation:proton antiporter [Alphaproteobacteria bacterium]MBT5158742.1 cation:proton antiporter [Alphaproteobacteria bacterium]MBT6386831.1 cation:proton antiporter [Alphaproteobacteria bacterium]